MYVCMNVTIGGKIFSRPPIGVVWLRDKTNCWFLKEAWDLLMFCSSSILGIIEAFTIELAQSCGSTSTTSSANAAVLLSI